jgi:DNA repair exonuclease SbcCD ATPase subunit
MELVSVQVERFGRIAAAQIQLRPGLNVLHGSNEIGKSSLARAIRFGLLLPSGSTAADAYVPWTGGGQPRVTLVLRTKDDEYFRVTKVFGSSMASLERSLDRTSWSSVARGRDVEGKLRSLLGWGIPEPGGAKSTKGLPESFLAASFLADQDAVEAIFDRDLEEDPDSTGRDRIREALQALAQDPLFREVLEKTQARVDEAFTPSGQAKRGASDPLPLIAREVKERQRESDEAVVESQKARALERTVTELQERLAEAEEALKQAEADDADLQRRRALQVQLATRQAELDQGLALVRGCEEARERVAAADAQLKTLEPGLAPLREKAEEMQKALERALADQTHAQEKRLAELDREETAILREREGLQQRRRRAQVMVDLRKADDLRAQGAGFAQRIQTLDAEIRILEAVDPWRAMREARRALDQARDRERERAGLLAEAARLRERATLEWPTPLSGSLPDERRLNELRALRSKVDRAEAKLDVGLSIEVRGSQAVSVSLDGGTTESRPAPFSVEAKGTAHLVLADGSAVLVRGGRVSDRTEAEKLRKEWREATALLFATAEVPDLDALGEACRADAVRRQQAEKLQRDAASAEARREALGDAAAEEKRQTQRIAELEEQLGDADLAAVEAAAEKHGPAVRGLCDQKKKERAAAGKAQAELAVQEAALRAGAVAEPGDTPADPGKELDAVHAAELALEVRAKKLAEGRRTSASAPAEQAALMQEAERALKALKERQEQIRTAEENRNAWDVRLNERIQGAGTVNLAALTKAVEEARAALGPAGETITDPMLVQAREHLKTKRSLHERIAADLQKAQGALVASGGAAAEERIREAEEALHRAQERQLQVEDEYEGWKLLAETLKEAERTQSTHLGNVLAPDLSARFRALTGERYEGVALGPHLGLEGIRVAGEPRMIERLSTGTREQLSTIFRLCLAERLRSAVVLDDQLAQSDTGRLVWFRRALQETARAGVQVVVLTCRPEDYLDPAQPVAHVVDLATVVKHVDDEPAEELPSQPRLRKVP